jgi:hypothetical protein
MIELFYLTNFLLLTFKKCILDNADYGIKPIILSHLNDDFDFMRFALAIISTISRVIISRIII